MKIVSLAPSNTEILYRLGAGDEVVATTTLCDTPEEAARKPSVGGWTNPKIERIHRFDPDLVLASDDLQDKAVEQIQAEGYPVLQVKPHSLEEVYESINTIGERIGRVEEAKELVDEIKQGLSGIELESDTRIYCEEWMDPPMVSGNWVPGLVEEVGGSYFIEEGRSREFDLEDLKQFDPEYIFLNICGAGENLSTEVVTDREDWQDLTAVKEGNVFVVDDSEFNRPSPRLLDAADTIKDLVDSQS